MERFQQLLRSFPGKGVGEVLVMVEMVPEPSCKGGFSDDQGHS
jgi:hypothetical protein